ncbi:YraN family protein [Larkinella soli]|uniref:YraN family protein n=1 Tax=Larkinella soli TaxID=1770527 RepID=UPI000FFB892C|nr:YraN family protein [Larkinella soli]
MAQHNETGKEGEAIAGRFLENKGYRILERNFRYGHTEIDLIAQKEKLLLFVEVKTRSGNRFGHPEEFVSSAKVRLVMRAAEHYIFAKDWPHDVRFDIVAVLTTPNGIEVSHIEDAFY